MLSGVRGARSAWFLLALVLVLSAVIASCNNRVARPSPSPAQPDELAVVWEAWNNIAESYVSTEDLEAEKVSRAVIAAMAEELGRDPEAAFAEAVQGKSAAPQGVPLELAPVWRFWREVRREAPAMEEAQRTRLVGLAVESMVKLLGGPNEFLSAEDLERQREQLTGEYVGVGAVIADVEGELVVVNVIPDSPAEEEGLRPGDTIVAIDGQPARGLTVEESAQRVRGPQGTQVTLTVQRAEEAGARDFAITRRAVRLPSIGAAMSGDIAYLRVATFYDTTGQEFVDTLFDLLRANARGFILDLRQNPGGSLNSAMKIASQFLGEGQKLVMYEIDNTGKRTDWTTEEGGLAPNAPLVVLVDENTVSSGEVLAGALRHYGRAVLVGKKTFGKGTVNTLLTLSDGSAIYLSTARWFTPAGEAIEGAGIEPDINVEITERDRQLGRDSQLAQAVDELLRLLGGSREPARS